MKTTHSNSELQWHLENNVVPKLSEAAITGILNTIDSFNSGKLTIEIEVKEGAGISVGEMFEDLKIDIE
ncbi:MAG: hypothetical protein WCP52_02140 [Bacteroidota bacterium]